MGITTLFKTRRERFGRNNFDEAPVNFGFEVLGLQAQSLKIFRVWTFLAVASFALFLGGVFALTRRGFDAQGGFQRRALPLLAATVLAFFVWIFALRRVPPPYPVGKTRFYIPPHLK